LLAGVAEHDISAIINTFHGSKDILMLIELAHSGIPVGRVLWSLMRRNRRRCGGKVMGGVL